MSWGNYMTAGFPDTFGQAHCTNHVSGRVPYPEARMTEEVTICDTTALYIATWKDIEPKYWAVLDIPLRATER